MMPANTAPPLLVTPPATVRRSSGRLAKRPKESGLTPPKVLA
jgi:hypothetical protein